MHSLFIGQVFGHGQSHLGSDEPLHHRIVGQIDEHGHMVQDAAFPEGPFKIFRHIIFYTHGGKNNSKFFIGIVPQRRLHDDLGGQLVMGQAVAGEDRQLLAPDQGRKAVDGRDPGADIVSWVFSGHGVQALSVDIQPFFGKDRSQAVDGISDAVEGAPQHIHGHSDLHGMASEPGVGIAERHVFRALKDLDHGFILIDLDDAAQLFFLSVYGHFHDLIIGGSGNAFQDRQGAV